MRNKEPRIIQWRTSFSSTGHLDPNINTLKSPRFLFSIQKYCPDPLENNLNIFQDQSSLIWMSVLSIISDSLTENILLINTSFLVWLKMLREIC